MKHLVLTNAHFIYWHLQFDEWIKTIGYGNGKETAYASNIKEFLHFLETNNICSVKDVNQHHIGQYYLYISNRPKLRTKGILSASSINHQMLALRLFFDYLLDCKEIDYSPARIPKFRLSGHNPRNIVTVDEIKLIYKKAKTLQNKAIISCAYGCGLRRNEIVNLNVSDIDLKNKTLLVRVAKGGKTRLIPLSDIVAKHFKKYLKFHQNNFEQTNFKQLPCFISSNGSRMRGSKINQTLKTIILNTNNHELIGKNITLHCLRHSIAVHLINNGAAITFVQTYLGHSSVDTTNLYAIRRKRKSAILRAFR
ncbi:MAG: tyrosine-type recombinase/integrase [Bacteroidia bacterium]